ncbi:MAG: OmpA family protein, partial [Bacteroidota bacterium]
FFVIFMVLFLVGCVACSLYYKDSILGYGPHISASEHGGELDSLFNVTLIFTGIVFFITQILLFWFAYKYKYKKGRVALFMPHDNKLEMIWTAVPAIVMSFLVIQGLMAWNKVMADVGEDEEYIEIEATGMQFAWIMRYPGADGVLGTKDYRLITPNNQLGQDWSDEKNEDDIVSSAAGEVVKLPVGKKVRVRITARDVLHNFDLPHFRVKMDAIPGLPTYFVLTPTVTTEEYRQNLGALDREGNPLYPEWHEPYDPTDPESKPRWQEFNYELACAELCGKGHYSMRRIIEVVSYEEWLEWMESQKSYYWTSIRYTDEDPNKDILLDPEINERRAEFNDLFNKAIASENEADKVLRLSNVTFETGSAKLSGFSIYELDNLVLLMKDQQNLTIELAGHTDNVGDAEANELLSQQRADVVRDYLLGNGVEENRLVAVGYGQRNPVDTNDTDAGRENNRRTEFKILTQ